MPGLTVMHTCSRYNREDLQTIWFSLRSFLSNLMSIIIIIIYYLPDASLLITQTELSLTLRDTESTHSTF